VEGNCRINGREGWRWRPRRTGREVNSNVFQIVCSKVFQIVRKFCFSISIIIRIQEQYPNILSYLVSVIGINIILTLPIH
jgi:hypothetical protein